MFSYHIDGDLRLELPEPRHAAEATVVVRRNLKRLQEYMPWAVDSYSEGHAQQWIARARETYAKDGQFNAVILFRDQIIGTIGFHDLDVVHRHAAIGYWIDKDHEGKGIVTRCCRALIEYLFEKLELNRIQINCNVENTRSRAVPERLGFKYEGTLRQVEFLNGKFGDRAAYALLREEWDRAKPRS